MGETAALSIIRWLSEVPGELVMLLISGIPVTELRGSIPVAMTVMADTWAWPWWKVYLLAVAGNMAPVPFILWFLEPVSGFLSRWKPFERFFRWLFDRTRRKVGDRVEKYRALGLAVFVAIPLPMTGAWTGSAAAFLFGIPRRLALPAIALGVVVAGAVVTLIVSGVFAALGFLL